MAKLTLLSFWKRHKVISRLLALLLVAVMLFSIFYPIYESRQTVVDYELSGPIASLLDDPVELYAEKLVQNNEGGYAYNEGYVPGGDVAGDSHSPKITASFGTLPNNMVSIDDPVNKVTVSFEPKFRTKEPLKNANRIVYPILGKSAKKVYTLKANGIKEDIILERNQGDTFELKYNVQLSDGTELRLENDGSLAVYGANTALLGSISASTDEDAELLKKARENAEKTTLLFTIPAPFVIEANKKPSAAKAWFGLNKGELTIYASGLEQANYPISIDPSVYVDSVSKLMRGNNETNIDFNIDNELIQKGSTTGARFDEWISTLPLNENRWDGGLVMTGGYVYYIGGSTTNMVTVEYDTAGTENFVVPAGVTSITIKAWGAGGGGGGASNDRGGGNGGGAGYAGATVAVTPAESLSVRIGGGGAGGNRTASQFMGGGGAGGGYSGVVRGGTALLVAPGGGGGGGGNGDSGSTARAAGSPGGAGGGNNGIAGTGNGTTTGGGAGTQTTGGTAGTSNSSGGTAGSSLTGGSGASMASTYTATSTNGGGRGGDGQTGTTANRRPGGGGGGGGYFGGGGAGRANARYNGGGGGGGGSSRITGTLTATTAGSGINPGNLVDPDRGTAGQGGDGGTFTGSSGTVGSPGNSGKVIISYSSGTGGGTQSTVFWGKLSTATSAIESANPGTGTCTNWCTDPAYDLPAPREGLYAVGYNGFLYVMGGVNASGNRTNTVYIAKLGANGEPQRWHPTNTNPSSWDYWYQDTNLSSERSYMSAAAYNNRIYILGGQTNASSGGITTVQYANISPVGTLSAWTATGMAALPSVRHSHDVHVYNDRMYLIGGNSNGTLQSSVHYARINNDGTMNAWQSTSSMGGPRASGGNFTAIWGGYIYMAGGCSAINGSGYCTNIQDDMQLASINADGSLNEWGTINNLIHKRTGYGLITWRNAIYGIGGCTNQNLANGDCMAAVAESNYGVINQDGDASTVAESESAGTPPCSGVSASNCDLPGTSHLGNMLNASTIMNGYLYVIGGCTNNTCTGTGSVSGNVAYAAIGTDGLLTRPATCPGGTFQGEMWCVDTTRTITGGVLAAGITTFDSRIYVVGGQNQSGLKGNVYRVTINPDGSLDSTWTAQTFASIGATSVSYTFAYTRANPAAAASNPGNLYIFGGCSATGGGIGCSSGSNTQAVFKCNITNTGAVAGCSTTGQLQIGTVPGATNPGLALHAGTVYANYIYLIGGVAPGLTDLPSIRYARFNDSNNVVAVTGSAWIQASEQLSFGRRRGTSFGYNGYLYVVGGFDAAAGGGGVLSDIQFAKINVSDGSLSSFNESAVEINQRWGLNVAVSNAFAFVIGGCTNGNSPTCQSGGPTNMVQTFQIYNNDSGTPTGYSTGAQFSTDRFAASSAVHNGYLYVAGGCTSATDCTTAINSVQYASLDAYGNVGSWSATSASLPAVRAWGQLEAVGGTLYYIGGQNSAGAAQTTVYYATPQSNGNVTGSWSTASNGLPVARSQIGATVWNNRIYVLGGNGAGTGCTGGVCNSVYISPQLNSGGNITTGWSTSGNPFNVARSGATAIAYANNLYILGGYTGSAYLSDVQFTKINANGTITSWTYTTSLPSPIRQAEGFAANGYMYLVGGRSSDSNCRPRTLVAPISANTTIASGNNPTGTGEWYETNASYTGDRYGAAVSYHEGKLYVLGGTCIYEPYPEVLSVNTSLSSTDNTTNNVTMPATVDPGDLLLVLFSNDGNATVTTPSGWTAIGNAANGSNVRGSVWAKLAAGTEDGTNVNFVTSANEKSAAQVYRIRAGTWRNSGTLTSDVNISASATGNNASPNPASLNPGSWDVENTLWIAYSAASSHTSIGGTPAGFTDPMHVNSTGGAANTNASASSARMNSAVASNDPGTFTTMGGGTQQWLTYTVAVRPVAPALINTGSDRVKLTAVRSQPQVARYSRMIDTDSNVFPNGWLMNGLDNDIGSRWNVRYRSSTAAAAAWGQETNFGPATMGRVETYTPLDGSGSNTNFARFFYFSISIDSSQTYGYPDDVTRGPTIDDLSLFFTGDPNKRLRHGKTFTGGELQPLDTPCRYPANPLDDPNRANCSLPED